MIQEMPRLHRHPTPSGDLRWFEWGHARADLPSLLLLHATGFHARIWDATIAALPHGVHVIALDLPGHGGSYRPPNLHDWAAVAQMVSDFATAVLPQRHVGVGHSMGGHMLLRIAAMDPSRLHHAILVDPVIMAPEAYELSPDSFPSAGDHPVARRRNRWTSVEEMVDRYAGRDPFALWQPRVLADYCRHGLIAAADGDGLELACPPELEVSVYISAIHNSPLALIDKVKCPVTVVRAQRIERQSMHDFSGSPTWPALAEALPLGVDLYWPDLTHFIPMQAPERLATLIMTQIRAAKQG